MNRSLLTVVRPDDDGPTGPELDAIEAEMPLITAEVEMLDAQIAVLDRAPSLLDERRLRRAHQRLLAARTTLANTHARKEAGA